MISKVFISKVRSLESMDCNFDAGINVICGPNGCGKTTILESIHLLAQGFSFRSRDLRELITWKNNELILRGEFEDEGRSRTRALRVHSRGSEVRENGESLKSPTAFFGTCPAVIMQPSDIELLRGGPEVRRHWLDEILCYRSSANAQVLRRYKRVLQQRNKWLKEFKQNGAAVGGEDLFRVLTQQLIDLGAKLWAARIMLSKEVSEIITRYYRKLSGGVDEITCAYKSSILKSLDALDVADSMTDEMMDEIPAGATVASESGVGIACGECAESSSSVNADGNAADGSDAPSEEMLRNAFSRKLADLEFVERLQGMTMAGPHRDDLALCASGYEMRSVGSQGQCRSAAVAMRFAAVDVASRYLTKPILLLDDIFAELDVNRRDAVASLIREKQCQVVIATPQAEDLPFKADVMIQLKI
ncbi:DNA replication/repair protein RecF [Fibrobacter sp. UWB12]|uniref:DNA replication/repair protein RecF n=1 Tax=Fibrobacter sp. UWB12 TaxID=1896203 RepID=UPI000916496B|nr:DNA replication and repair protein RecF [Fibrobacter sp. UWB12]SHK89953.1 DNA replication and repair protein RecF [Fibrobacter sp. UWB12]